MSKTTTKTTCRLLNIDSFDRCNSLIKVELTVKQDTTFGWWQGGGWECNQTTFTEEFLRIGDGNYWSKRSGTWYRLKDGKHYASKIPVMHGGHIASEDLNRLWLQRYAEKMMKQRHSQDHLRQQRENPT